MRVFTTSSSTPVRGGGRGTRRSWRRPSSNLTKQGPVSDRKSNSPEVAAAPAATDRWFHIGMGKNRCPSTGALNCGSRVATG